MTLVPTFKMSGFFFQKGYAESDGVQQTSGEMVIFTEWLRPASRQDRILVKQGANLYDENDRK